MTRVRLHVFLYLFFPSFCAYKYTAFELHNLQKYLVYTILYAHIVRAPCVNKYISKGLFIELKQLNSFHNMFCVHCENCLWKLLLQNSSYKIQLIEQRLWQKNISFNVLLNNDNITSRCCIFGVNLLTIWLQNRLRKLCFATLWFIFSCILNGILHFWRQRDDFVTIVYIQWNPFR